MKLSILRPLIQRRKNSQKNPLMGKREETPAGTKRGQISLDAIHVMCASCNFR